MARSSDAPVGAIAGGVVAGVVLVVVVLLAVILYRRRHSTGPAPDKASLDLERDSQPSTRQHSYRRRGSSSPAEREDYLAVDPNGPQALAEATTPATAATSVDEEQPATEAKQLGLQSVPEEAEAVQMAEGGIYSSQLSQENQKLRDELQRMQEMLIQKEAASATTRFGNDDDEEVESALAQRLRDQNKQLKKQIADLRTSMQRNKHKGRLQQEALMNIRLKMEKAALEEEVAAIEQVTQVKAKASAQLREKRAEYQRKQEQEAKLRERERIQREIEEMKSRLSQLDDTPAEPQ